MKFPPIIAPVMKNRASSLIVMLLPLIFILLNIFELFIWKCPFYSFTGIECPGCGMTRGAISVAKGDILAAFHFHPFSFLLVVSWSLWCIILLVPAEKRTNMICKIEKIESKTGFVFILTLLFITFGLARLIFQI